jgi:hypothetical protein
MVTKNEPGQIADRERENGASSAEKNTGELRRQIRGR